METEQDPDKDDTELKPTARKRSRGFVITVGCLLVPVLLITLGDIAYFISRKVFPPRPDESQAVRTAPKAPSAMLGGSSERVSPTETVQDSAASLPAMPGLAQRTVSRQLSGRMDKFDPVQDAWPVEVFNQQASGQLKILAALLTSEQPITPAALQDLAIEEIELTPLRPRQLSNVFSETSLVVRRPSERLKPDSGTAVRLKGLDSLAKSLEGLRQPLIQGSRAHVHTKIVRANLELGLAISRVRFHAWSHVDEGVVQQNAIWQCHWRLDESDSPESRHPPRLSKIILEHYEEIVPRSEQPTLFIDRTANVIGADESLVQQAIHGIDHWRRTLEKSIGPDLMGYQGLAIGDVNGDLLEDVYVCQQGGLPNLLLVQRADGTVENRAVAAGVDFLDLTRSVLLVDMDNDGDQDLVIGLVQSILLFENDGSGNFRQRWRSVTKGGVQSIAAADVDGDRLLDLYVCGYSPGQDVWRSDSGQGAPLPYHDANNGGSNTLLKNEGNWQLRDVTAELGLDQNNRRFSFAASWEDYDNDGDQDLYVANDFGRNNLYRNDDGRFVDVAAEVGVEDISTGMSVSWADYDRDGFMDLYVGNMFSSAGNRVAYQRSFLPAGGSQEKANARRTARGNSLFRNMGNGHFSDQSEAAAVAMGRWAWSSKFVDLNNDGWQDILVANGFVTNSDSKDL